MGELSKLKNIGKEVEQQLNQVGIYTMDDLESLGTLESWLRIQSIDPSACIHRLYGLEGAIQGILKKDLSEESKQWLKEFYNEHKLY